MIIHWGHSFELVDMLLNAPLSELGNGFMNAQIEHGNELGNEFVNGLVNDLMNDLMNKLGNGFVNELMIDYVRRWSSSI